MNVNALSNENLVSCFENFVRSERKITGQVLECIGEIDRRRIYTEKGCTSLFSYLVKDFGYSPGAAMRRIDGARLLKELPEVGPKFEKGSLNLSQATQIERASRELKKTKKESITSDQKRDLISKIENCSQKETEKTIAAKLDLPIVPVQKATTHRDESVTLTITLSAEQMRIIEQAQNMISHSVPDKNWADVFTFLAKKEVARRTTIRNTRISDSKACRSNASKSETQNPKTCSSENRRSETNLSEAGEPKEAPIAAATAVKNPKPLSRRAIPARDRKRLLHPTATCEHRDSDRRPCKSPRFLQIDHIQSWSRGGTHHPENLQVLCGVHNRLKYQKERSAKPVFVPQKHE